MHEKQKPNAPKRGDSSKIIAALTASKLKFLQVDFSRHGKLQIRVRRNGKTIHLKNKPLSPEFYMEYGIALGELSSVSAIEINLKSDSLEWLCLEYLRSGRYSA
ncbi:MAG: hypothetical protein ACKVH1_11610, partial [Alphaproteobacteria bacterium]